MVFDLTIGFRRIVHEGVEGSQWSRGMREKATSAGYDTLHL